MNRSPAAARVSARCGAPPRRLLPVHLPVWAIEVTATVREALPYGVFDLFLSRALAEGGFDDAAGLAGFLGVTPALAERGLRDLAGIGHVRREGGCCALTELGFRSLADGCRYVHSAGRRLVLHFEGITGAPLPPAHAAETAPGGPGVAGPPRTSAVYELLRRRDVERFTGPAVPIAAQPVRADTVWLPGHAADCGDAVLLVTRAGDGADAYLGGVLEAHLRELLTQSGSRDGARGGPRGE